MEPVIRLRMRSVVCRRWGKSQRKCWRLRRWRCDELGLRSCLGTGELCGRGARTRGRAGGTGWTPSGLPALGGCHCCRAEFQCSHISKTHRYQWPCNDLFVLAGWDTEELACYQLAQPGSPVQGSGSAQVRTSSREQGSKAWEFLGCFSVGPLCLQLSLVMVNVNDMHRRMNHKE